jgi:tryptophanyl-tRNA synthetase
VQKGKNIPCLIPHAIDQDPHFRVTRDIMPKLGYYKPAAIHSMFLPGLQGIETKMSASKPESVIFTTDDPKTARKKIMRAFSGGAGSLDQHRKEGGKPEIDVAYQYLFYIFEPDDGRIREIHDAYKSGAMTSGEMKEMLAGKVEAFLKKHQENREKARKKLDKFILRD